MVNLKANNIGFWAGIVFFLFLIVFPVSADNPIASDMAAIALLMAIWWMSEAIPIAATSLIPIILLPLLGVDSGKNIASQYFNSTIFLFLGGFLIAIALEKWSLHKRLALNLLDKIGTNPKSLIFGFMLSSFLLSMFISNTATTIMMLPIGLSVIKKLEDDFDKKLIRKFSVALMLGIAYSASIGGTVTLVGTAPNLAFKTIYNATFHNQIDISFYKWLLYGIPSGLVMFLIIKYLLLNVFCKIDNSLKIDSNIIKDQLVKLRIISFEEKTVLAVLSITSLLWIFRTDIDLSFLTIPGWSNLLPNPKMIDDGTVSIMMALCLFIIPSKKVKGEKILSRKAINNLPWDIILLFGGGFALASGFESTGLSTIIGNQFKYIEGVPVYIVTLLVCLVMTFLTELTSNTATTYTMLPIFASIAVAIGIDPLAIMLPATMTASYAFMFPVATPPNAIVYSSGKIKIKEMVRIGFVLNIISVFVSTLLYYIIGQYVWAN